jgi:prepilin-type N-terminal cleavage/methylation domain-containing protein
MKLRKHCLADNRNSSRTVFVTHNGAGFTLIEMLIVLALVAVLASFGLVVGVGSYQRSTFRSQQDLLVGALQKARSRALANLGQCNHGVRFTENSYELFAEDDGVCDTEGAAGEVVVLEGSVTLVAPDELLFLRLSGNTRAGGGNASITLTSSNLPESGPMRITVGENGRIGWE